MINLTNEKYRECGLALVQKVPTPITPIQIDKHSRHITHIFRIAQERMPVACKLRTDLVCLSRKQFHLKIGKTIPYKKGAVGSFYILDCPLPRWRHRKYLYPVRPPILYQVSLCQNRLRNLPDRNTGIIFMQVMFPECLRHGREFIAGEPAEFERIKKMLGLEEKEGG